MFNLFGGIPEWSKGADCKSVAKASKVRILLPPPKFLLGAVASNAGVAQW